MKIAIADSNNRKFTQDIIDYWEGIGLDVKFEIGASEHLAQWADIYYIDTWDNNVSYLYDLYHGNPRGIELVPTNKPKIVVRVLDWEVWCGFIRYQKIVDWVDKIIFIAPHIQERVSSEVDLKGKDVLIRPGVNMDKFPLKTSETDGFQIGMVLGDMWWLKNHMAGLDVFATIALRSSKPWRLHIRGQHEGGEYYPEMFQYYIESRGIKDKVLLYPPMDDMNEFYEKIDYLLHPSLKEAFSYSVAEAMCKGIKPIVNDFLGSRDIWKEEILYKTNAEALLKFSYSQGRTNNKRRGQSFRDYIEKNYSLEKMLLEYSALIRSL